MTVNEYSKKHKRCRTCKHLSKGLGYDICKAKGSMFWNGVERTKFKAYGERKEATP